MRMSPLSPNLLTEVDLALLNELVAVARERHDGHLTVMRFTTNWRVGFGTLRERSDISRIPKGATFAEAARVALTDPHPLHDYPNETEKLFAQARNCKGTRSG
jgi:hypothetical protein